VSAGRPSIVPESGRASPSVGRSSPFLIEATFSLSPEPPPAKDPEDALAEFFDRLAVPKEPAELPEIPYLPELQESPGRLPRFKEILPEGADPAKLDMPLVLGQLHSSDKLMAWQANALLWCSTPVFSRLFSARREPSPEAVAARSKIYEEDSARHADWLAANADFLTYPRR